MCPPRSSGTHTSYAETEKAYGATISVRWCQPVSQQESATRSRTPRCVTATPLGWPVEPEV